MNFCEGASGILGQRSIAGLVGFCLLWVFFFFPGYANADARSDAIRIIVSVSPHAYFVERIGGDHVEVTALIDQNNDPHTYSPTPTQVVAAARAKLYFRAGMPFEAAFTERLRRANADLKIEDLTRGLGEATGGCCASHAHSHNHEVVADSSSGEGEEGHSHAHEHEMMVDPHIWLSPLLAQDQARRIRDALIAADPENEAHFERNFQTFRTELAAVHAQLTERLRPFHGTAILVYHAAFGYFCREYGLHQYSIELAGREPTPREIRDVIRDARKSKVSAVFVQPQFDDRGARIVADAIGAKVVSIDPLAPDYLTNLIQIGEAFEQSAVGSDHE